MGFFNSEAKKIAAQHGGIKNMFRQFIDAFEAEGFFIETSNSDSFMLKNEAQFATGLIELKLINETSIRIKFFMTFLDDRVKSVFHFEEYYNLSNSQDYISHNLMQKIDKEIAKRE